MGFGKIAKRWFGGDILQQIDTSVSYQAPQMLRTVPVYKNSKFNEKFASHGVFFYLYR